MVTFSSFITGAYVITTGYVTGLLHAMNIVGALKMMCSSKDALLGTLKCVGANMFLIVGSDALLSKFIIPLIRNYGLWVFEDTIKEETATSSITLLPLWVEYLASGIYYSTWLFPIWILVYLAVNIPTYAELASISFSKTKLLGTANKKTTQPERNSTKEEEIYRFIFFFFLIVQKYTLRALPDIGYSIVNLGAIGRFFSFIFSMLICSLSAFEYSWHQQGVPVPKRHAFIEHAWPYFLGFGTPATVLTFFSPLFVSLGLSACLFPFPLFLSMGCLETAEMQVNHSSQHIPKLPIFKPTRDVTEIVASSLVSLVLGKKSEYIAKLRYMPNKQMKSSASSSSNNNTPSVPASSNKVPSTDAVESPQPHTSSENAPSSQQPPTSSPKTTTATRRLTSPPSHLKEDISRGRSMSTTG